MSPTLSETALAATGSVGRYFNLVSAVPTALLISYVYLLWASGAMRGAPSFDQAAGQVRTLDWRAAVVLAIVTFVISILLHPFQFGLTQLLEGYWGTSHLARAVAHNRTQHYREAARALQNSASRYHVRWDSNASQLRLARAEAEVHVHRRREYVSEIASENGSERKAENLSLLDAAVGDALLGDYLSEQAYIKQLHSYPRDARRTMPTRLGNALRSFEDAAGAPYGLDAVRVAPHLAFIAPVSHTVRVSGVREMLDFSIRLCVVSLIAVAISLASLATDGLWLAVTLVPYCVAYLAYRGAIVAARSYGVAVKTMIDLNRFSLYRTLHLPAPTTLQAEREQNAALMRSLSGSHEPTSYRHDEVGTAQTSIGNESPS